MYERILKLCNKSGISIRYLEQKLGLANGSIRKWTDKNIKLEKAERVASFFGLTLDELVYGKSNK